MVRAAALVFLVACAGPSKPAPVARAPERCAYVADHLLTLLSPTAREAPAEELDRVRAHFHARCAQDGWSPAAQQCFLELRVKEDVDRCASLLTDAQRAALEAP